MDVREREYTRKEVAQATGLEPKVISDWGTKGFIVGQAGGGVQGKNRKFSFMNIMEIALAAALIKEFGFKPQTAFQCATMFAHVGADGRSIGLPFAKGVTLLVITGQGATGAKVVQINQGKIDLSYVLPQWRRGVGAILVNASFVFEQTVQRLGLDSREVLEGVYGDVK